jgi:hypothetical protein
VGGCLGARQDGRCRRWLGSVAVGPDGGRDGGGFFDLSGSDRSGGQQTNHDTDARRDMTIAAPPASDASRVDAEPLRGAVLCEAEGVERRAKLVCSRGTIFSKAGRRFFPSRVA